MKRLFTPIITALLLLATGCSNAPTMSQEEADAYRRADKLMKKMTLREKLGQLEQFITRKGVVTGPEGVKRDIESAIRNGEVGSFLSVFNREDSHRLQKIAIEESRLGIPLIIGCDIIHGCRIIFPENLAMSCSWNIEAIEHSARIAAEESAASGIHWTFSPMCDISTDPRWSRVSEGAGEDPYLGAKIAAAMVRGYQGDDLSAPNTIAACVKHFAAYGAAQAGRDYHTVDMSELMFRDRYLPPYIAALEAGAVTVMSSFNDFMGVPASGNRWLLHTLLREELGFTGFVVSDWNAVHEMIIHGVAADGKDAAELAMKAHLNMDMVGGDYIAYGEELVKEGRISEKLIDNLCREVLAVKYRLGLFEDPYRYGSQNQNEAYYRPENMEFARKVAGESMVLLKNDGVLPLAKDTKIALIGPFADAPKDQLGAWRGKGEPERSITFRQALEERFGKQNVLYTKACECGKGVDRVVEGGIREAVKLAKQADVVLLSIGLSGWHSGESRSRAELTVPAPQQELLDALKKTGKKIVVLLSTGRAMDIRNEVEKADAVLLTWHAGTMAGPAVADIVSGDTNPSGHLTISFPYSVGQVPVHYNAKTTGRPAKDQYKASGYSSSYVDIQNAPLFPFGYGLSYTEFEYSDLQVLTPEVKLGGTVKVSVKVKNVGKRAGDDVAQLYIRDVVAETTRPVRELKSFERLTLAAGEERVVEFEVPTSDLAYCHSDMSFKADAGDFIVWAGADSNATLQGEFKIVE
ncbi:MAG: beta-glucosidase BglX [Alistipes sp.]|nr:beta-glucosidase BglX [Alistipes sp.]